MAGAGSTSPHVTTDPLMSIDTAPTTENLEPPLYGSNRAGARPRCPRILTSGS